MRLRKLSLTLSLAISLLDVSCERFGEGKAESTGELHISFSSKVRLLTRAHPELPDTNDFNLTIKKPDGTVLYNGKFGDCPERLDVSSGPYVIRAESGTFTKPAFDSPLYGDEQCVVVPSGGRVNARLVCTQLNAGVRLDIAKEFLAECPDAVLFLTSADGKLMYSYSEKRTAYFRPGTVSLMMSKGGVDETLMTCELNAREVHLVKINIAETGIREGVSMAVDTSRIWLQEEYTIGGSSGAEVNEVLTVAEARMSVGAEDVWVCGYVVGGDLTSASASFDPPFESMTNILLGPKSTTADKAACLSVQLPSGEIRDALNLAEQPDMFRRRIKIRGNIVSAYFGIPGMKNVREYELL